MIRIYLTDDGIEGYHEGCSCCSAREHASISDIDILIGELYSQIDKLEELKFLTKKYGEDNLVSWSRQSAYIRTLNYALEAAKKYSNDPTTQGTYYKQSFDNWEENIELLADAQKIYSKVPARFKKYIESK